MPERDTKHGQHSIKVSMVAKGGSINLDGEVLLTSGTVYNIKVNDFILSVLQGLKESGIVNLEEVGKELYSSTVAKAIVLGTEDAVLPSPEFVAVDPVFTMGLNKSLTEDDIVSLKKVVGDGPVSDVMEDELLSRLGPIEDVDVVDVISDKEEEKPKSKGKKRFAG